MESYEKMFLVGVILILMLISFTVGIFWDEVLFYTRDINGVYFQGDYDKKGAINKATESDKGGHWVCVNVRDMSFDEAVETCKHETGHELYARKCAKNTSKCFGG